MGSGDLRIIRRRLAGPAIGDDVIGELLTLVKVVDPARSTALIWTNTSLLLSSGWMKPEPFVGSNHFTVPCGMRHFFPIGVRHGRWSRSRSEIEILEEGRQSDA